jgi:alpha-amylase
LNNGWISGWTDLDTESDYVRERTAAYLTDLISIGFSGYRIEAAKHIQPDSLAAILGKLKRNLGGGDLPADFMTYLDILIGDPAGGAELLECNYSSYQYTTYFDDAMKLNGFSDSDIAKVKIWSSDYP